MLKRKRFCEIIARLKEVNDFVNEVNKKTRNLSERLDFFNASSLFISSEDLVVELLQELLNDEGEMISYWIYELDYGKKYKDGCVIDENGLNINIRSAGKLYDYLTIGKK